MPKLATNEKSKSTEQISDVSIPTAWRPSQSSFLWIILLLATIDIFLSVFRPLKFVYIQGTMLKDNDYVGIKINKLLTDHNQVNSYVFGDSTADSLCSFADMSHLKVKLNTVTRYSYDDAKFAQNQMQEQLGLPLKIKNAYFGGCLISDQKLMLQKLLENGARPKIIFLTVVPRPFIDTTVEENISPVKCYFEHRYRNLGQVKGFVELVDYLLATSSSIYKTRSDYFIVLSSLACSILERPLEPFGTKTSITKKNKVSLAGDEKTIDPDRNSDEDLSKLCMSFYKNAYRFDQKTYDFQLQNFKEMLNLLKSKKITTVIVKLPLGRENLELLQKNASAKWNQDVNKLAQQFDVHIVDLQNSNKFTSKDFLDTVHMTGPGAIKTWQCIVEDIRNDTMMHQKLKNQFNLETAK